MGSKLVDLTGERFGRLTVLKRAATKNGKTMWLCRCDCGNVKEFEAYGLKTGRSKSCGCYSVELVRERCSYDLSGKKFGKLTAIRPIIKNNKTYWECKCDCGRKSVVITYKLTSGHTTSCGCKKHPYDGESKSDLYMHYRAMKCRCSPKYHQRNVYYDKGIRVCDEWNKPDGYASFREWSLNNGYEEGLTLDRINNDGNYEPLNCRWTTMKVQQNNRSDNVVIQHNGESKTLKQWSEYLNLSYGMLKARRRKGINPPELFSPTKLNRCRNKTV